MGSNKITSSLDNISVQSSDIDLINDFFCNDLYGVYLPKISYIYCSIGLTTEIYYKDWIIMGFDEIAEKYRQYKTEGQEHVLPIALKYIGMGHVIVASINLLNSRDYIP